MLGGHVLGGHVLGGHVLGGHVLGGSNIRQPELSGAGADKM